MCVWGGGLATEQLMNVQLFQFSFQLWISTLFLWSDCTGRNLSHFERREIRKSHIGFIVRKEEGKHGHH